MKSRRDDRPAVTVIQVANNKWQLHWTDPKNGMQMREFLGQHAALQWADGKFSRIIEQDNAVQSQREERQ